MSKKINVNLVTEEEKELLVFNFDEITSIDLTSDEPEQLKRFFKLLLSEVIKEDISLEFNSDGRTDLFANVADKYIEHLNSEILSLKAKVPEKLVTRDLKESIIVSSRG